MHGLGHFFILYGYFLAVPVMILEGPIATMVMAVLASRGYFNIGVVFLLGFSSDLISDFIYYQIGYRGAQGIIEKLSRIFGFEKRLTEIFQKRFENHGGKAIFLAKVLPGVTVPVFIAAGLAKYPLKKLYKFAIPAGAVWTGGLTVLGYYFGRHIRNAESLLSKTGIILAVLVIAFILYQYIFGRGLVKRAFNKRDSILGDKRNDNER